MARKTVAVALTLEQFDQMKEAVSNYRRLRRQLRQLEQLSRRILFQSTPHPRRHKRLSQKFSGVKQAPFLRQGRKRTRAIPLGFCRPWRDSTADRTGSPTVETEGCCLSR
jgi:hypothetical protein